jgi:hypothetical protein
MELDKHDEKFIVSILTSICGCSRFTTTVHHLVGVAVTPVVCFFNQDLADIDLKPNADEVAEVFTIPLHRLMDKQQWIYKDDHAPIFVGGPYVM